MVKIKGLGLFYITSNLKYEVKLYDFSYVGLILRVVQFHTFRRGSFWNILPSDNMTWIEYITKNESKKINAR